MENNGASIKHFIPERRLCIAEEKKGQKATAAI